MGGIWVIRVGAISGFNSTCMYQAISGSNSTCMYQGRDKTFYCYLVI
jgi:hypothetical protein